MTLRQKILKLFYPLLRKISNIKADKAIFSNIHNKKPIASFYNLHVIANNGALINFTQFKGKKVLLVNTASDCGYTGQYEELQKLYEQYQEKLLVVGFPANDFKEQEKGSDEDIAQFCKINYGVTFPLIKKSSVIKGNDQNEVYQWLSNKNLNGWNDQQPTWNFAKYLINEEGVLTNYFAPSVSPLSNHVINAVLNKIENVQVSDTTKV
jgi:glutathione peroxidase